MWEYLIILKFLAKKMWLKVQKGCKLWSQKHRVVLQLWLNVLDKF